MKGDVADVLPFKRSFVRRKSDSTVAGELREREARVWTLSQPTSRR